MPDAGYTFDSYRAPLGLFEPAAARVEGHPGRSGSSVSTRAVPSSVRDPARSVAPGEDPLVDAFVASHHRLGRE